MDCGRIVSTVCGCIRALYDGTEKGTKTKIQEIIVSFYQRKIIAKFIKTHFKFSLRLSEEASLYNKLDISYVFAYVI